MSEDQIAKFEEKLRLEFTDNINRLYDKVSDISSSNVPKWVFNIFVGLVITIFGGMGTQYVTRDDIKNIVTVTLKEETEKRIDENTSKIKYEVAYKKDITDIKEYMDTNFTKIANSVKELKMLVK